MWDFNTIFSWVNSYFMQETFFFILIILIIFIIAYGCIRSLRLFKEYQKARGRKRTKFKDESNTCEAIEGKILRWIMFSIVLSLLPLSMKVLSLSTRFYEFSWGSIVSHGELLLVTITMCTTAIAELFCSGSDLKLPKLVIGSLTISVLIIASGYFSDISVAFELSRATDFDIYQILFFQLWFFVIAFILGIICIFLSES